MGLLQCGLVEMVELTHESGLESLPGPPRGPRGWNRFGTGRALYRFQIGSMPPLAQKNKNQELNLLIDRTC